MRFLVLAILTGSLMIWAGEPGAFTKSGYKNALKKATEENKMLFIDFYTTWCGPCKKLDAVTWKDETVVRWLKENTVAIKVDADRNKGLARKYQVRSYPTMMFINTDGTVMHRMIGYRSPKHFMRESHWFERDPFKRLKLGQELAKQGHKDQALAAWLWCLDNGMAVNPEFSRARESLYSHMVELAKTERSVRKAMKSRKE